MQTVVMSFARGLYLGKPELPIDHAHIYFPAQIVHKVTAQCEVLKLGEVWLDARKRCNIMWTTLLVFLSGTESTALALLEC